MISIVLKFLTGLVKSVGTTALTPVLEKNIVKTLATNSPLVVSMSRVIVLGFAAVMLRDFWNGGISGWPDAALGMAVVLALPLMSSLERANPDEVLALTRVLIARMSTREPSKLDDHRTD